MSGLSKEVLIVYFGPWAAELWVLKVGADRESNPGRLKSSDLLHKSSPKCKLWDFSIFFFMTANLMPYNFYPPGPKLTFNTSLERPDIFLYEKFKKIDLAAFLGSIMNTQSKFVS